MKRYGSATQSMGELFDVCSNRHRGNAESEAAFQSTKDRLSVQRERVLKAIRDSDSGLTAEEIAMVLGTTVNAISGRCSELKMAGRIYKSGTRVTRSGCSAGILKAI